MKTIIDLIIELYRRRNEKAYIKFLRSKGIKIGNNCEIPAPLTVQIDYSRPSLIEIGNNVRLNRDLTLMTHDYATSVFIRKYKEFINSSGKIKIGNNVYFGRKCTVLKGVTIGDNCIIGFGSLVLRDIPSNSVAAGVPAKVICSLDEYYKKRKEKAVGEAFEYARSIQDRFKRKPIPKDFREEFIYFITGDQKDIYPEIPIEFQLQGCYKEWAENHVSNFKSFDDFLNAAGIK